jgi:hypothetical protein
MVFQMSPVRCQTPEDDCDLMFGSKPLVDIVERRLIEPRWIVMTHFEEHGTSLNLWPRSVWPRVCLGYASALSS